MQDNLKINAIKLVRDNTNCGLKEAKDYVEGRAWGHPFLPIIRKIRKDYNLEK